MDETLYSTGEFAKLCGVKKQTLFHYDRIGLLKPTITDERGFRRYSYSQYQDYLIIACLKEAGMPLKEISQYLSTEDEAKRGSVLETCIQQLDEKISYLKRVRQILHSSFPQRESGHASSTELDKDTLLSYKEAKMYWATPRLDELDDKELVETVARIVKVAEFSAVCLPSTAVLDGDLETQSHLLIERERITSDEQAKELGLTPFTRPEGRYAEITLRPDESPELVYQRLLTDIQLMHCHPGEFFYEMQPENLGEDTTPATVITVELFLDDDAARAAREDEQNLTNTF